MPEINKNIANSQQLALDAAVDGDRDGVRRALRNLFPSEINELRHAVDLLSETMEERQLQSA